MGKSHKKHKRQRQEQGTSNSMHQTTTASQQAPPPNPLYEQQLDFLKSIPQNDQDNFFSSTFHPERRGQLWMQQAEIGESLINKYSWATPDETCLRIFQEFSPIIEIGCGSNAYWSRYMSNAGIDVVAYDINPHSGGMIQNGNKKKKKRTKQHSDSSSSTTTFTVKHGGPKVLQNESSGRTLFLCYPDEDGQVEIGNEGQTTTSMGAACLEYYTGDHVIHVGELFGDSLCVDQAPWGRSSSPDFQLCLNTNFHCILKKRLSNWLHVKDTISVWKRTQTCPIVFAADSDEEGDEEVKYRYIPIEERLPTNIAAPCLEHLLQENDSISKTSQAVNDTSNSQGKKQGTVMNVQKQNGSPNASSRDHSTRKQDYVCPW